MQEKWWVKLGDPDRVMADASMEDSLLAFTRLSVGAEVIRTDELIVAIMDDENGLRWSMWRLEWR